jgi:hypothetical protein
MVDRQYAAAATGLRPPLPTSAELTGSHAISWRVDVDYTQISPLARSLARILDAGNFRRGFGLFRGLASEHASGAATEVARARDSVCIA